MKQDFELLCFTIFFESNDRILCDIGSFFYEKKRLKNILIETETTSMKEWINPLPSPLSEFFLGSYNQDKLTIFLSNLQDGWSTAARFLSKKSKSRSIQIRLSGQIKYPVFTYEVIENGETIRIIQVLKEDKWTFFQKGKLLPFEDEKQLNCRMIKDRLDFETIVKYLEADGLILNNLFERELIGVRLKVKSWDLY